MVYEHESYRGYRYMKFWNFKRVECFSNIIEQRFEFIWILENYKVP